MILEEEGKPQPIAANGGGSDDMPITKKHPELNKLVSSNSSDGEGEESLSSGASTGVVSPETPVLFTSTKTLTKSKNNNNKNSNKLGSSTNLMDLVDDEADSNVSNDRNSNNNTHASAEVVPSPLLNGSQYEQPLQQPDSTNGGADEQQQQQQQQQQPQHPNRHRKRTSYLQDQFPSMDEDDEEEPLTVEDGSDHFNTQESAVESPPAPTHADADIASASASASAEHPSLRQRHTVTTKAPSSPTTTAGKPALLSKITIPSPARHPKKTDPGLQDDDDADYQEDFYPNPDDFAKATASSSFTSPPTSPSSSSYSLQFSPYYTVTKHLQTVSKTLFPKHQYDPTAAATWIGFWAMFLVTCSNYVLMPMRDAIALAVGVEHIPKLTLASTVLALFSSVPIGWLFEAPDPQRHKVFKKLGMTRGETQGTSLALFYRFFAMSLWSYAIGFSAIEFILEVSSATTIGEDAEAEADTSISSSWLIGTMKLLLQHLGKVIYIAFFLVVHLMKLHSLSLVWGVTTEAMEYEENARKRFLAKQQADPLQQKQQQVNDDRADKAATTSSKTRLQRLAFVGFGGTVGGILGSIIASSFARVMRLSGLLVFSGLMLEAAAQLAIELGRIMHKHWMQQQLFPSNEDLASLDPSMRRSASLGSMKRISSSNSLSRVKSMSEMTKTKQQQQQLGASGSTSSSLQSLASQQSVSEKAQQQMEQEAKEDSFSQRFLRGIRTILQSRLLMAIFTYNALYASTTVLLSFQRAELVATRNAESSKEADTAFLANINMASSVAVFALQASGMGAFIAHLFGPRGTLALMPTVRLLGVLTLAYWHQTSNGEPPNLLLFLMLDECCRVMNMAVAKPVRESLWRGLSNEARYEAKPIVDTLANRWGGGSAAFLVSTINKLLDLFGVPEASNGEARTVYGFPPVLFLCMVIAAWWAGVSADLGQIRRRIDLELKKMQ